MRRDGRRWGLIVVSAIAFAASAQRPDCPKRDDGGNVYPMRQSTAKVGRFPAFQGGIRSPSGCVNASMTWFGDGMQHSLQMVGPLGLEEQRRVLMEVASSIDSLR